MKTVLFVPQFELMEFVGVAETKDQVLKLVREQFSTVDFKACGASGEVKLIATPDFSKFSVLEFPTAEDMAEGVASSERDRVLVSDFSIAVVDSEMGEFKGVAAEDVELTYEDFVNGYIFVEA